MENTTKRELSQEKWAVYNREWLKRRRRAQGVLSRNEIRELHDAFRNFKLEKISGSEFAKRVTILQERYGI